MYRNNDIVEFDGKRGRVLHYDPVTHYVHVMVRLNDFTWKVEKCDIYRCVHVEIFLWTIENAFNIKHQNNHRTPNLRPMDSNDDYVMHIL